MHRKNKCKDNDRFLVKSYVREQTSLKSMKGKIKLSTKNSTPSKNKNQNPNKIWIFRQIEVERIHHQQTHAVTNADRRKTTTEMQTHNKKNKEHCRW